MRYGKGHAAETRSRIVAHASVRFRSDGIGTVGVRTLIGDAGLTHGAFYSHFDSKADLLAQAVAAAFAQTLAFWREKVAAVSPETRFETIVAGYLNLEHRAAMGKGCAGAALAPELAREGVDVCKAVTQGLADLVALIAETLPTGGGDQARRTRANAIFAGLMGTLQLSRLADDEGAAAVLAGGREVALATGRLPWDAGA